MPRRNLGRAPERHDPGRPRDCPPSAPRPRRLRGLVARDLKDDSRTISSHRELAIRPSRPFLRWNSLNSGSRRGAVLRLFRLRPRRGSDQLKGREPIWRVYRTESSSAKLAEVLAHQIYNPTGRSELSRSISSCLPRQCGATDIRPRRRRRRRPNNIRARNPVLSKHNCRVHRSALALDSTFRRHAFHAVPRAGGRRRWKALHRISAARGRHSRPFQGSRLVVRSSGQQHFSVAGSADGGAAAGGRGIRWRGVDRAETLAVLRSGSSAGTWRSTVPWDARSKMSRYACARR